MVIFNHDGTTDEFVVTNFNSGGLLNETFMAGINGLNYSSMAILMDNAASRKEMVFGYPKNNITYRFDKALDDGKKFRSMALFAFSYEGNSATLREVLRMGDISVTGVDHKWLSPKFDPSSSAPIDAVRITWGAEAQRALHIPVNFNRSP